jgi:hypothetical protein
MFCTSNNWVQQLSNSPIRLSGKRDISIFTLCLAIDVLKESADAKNTPAVTWIRIPTIVHGLRREMTSNSALFDTA